MAVHGVLVFFIIMEWFALFFWAYYVRPYPPSKVLSRPPTAKERAKTDFYSKYERGQHWIMDKTKSAPIRYAKKGIASREVCPAITVPELFKRVAKRKGDRTAMCVERPVGPYDSIAGPNGQMPSQPIPRHGEWKKAGERGEWKRWTLEDLSDETKKRAKRSAKKARESVIELEHVMEARYVAKKNKAEYQAPPPLPESAKWSIWTYEQYYDESNQIARAFLALGLERYDAVSIYGFNCPEWFMSQQAAMMSGGIAAGIYPSDTPAQVIYKAKHSGAAIACCQASKAQIFVDAFKKGDLPKLKAVIVWDDDVKQEVHENKNGDSLTFTSWPKALEIGKTQPTWVIDQIVDGMDPGDVCTLIYTSGTTGDPKAVMITHDNIIFESRVALASLPETMYKDQERIISYLPLSHVAGLMVDIVSGLVACDIRSGYLTVGFARSYDLSKGTIGERLRAIEPTLFLGVPRVWEKIQAKIIKIGATITGNKKKVSTFCKEKGLEHAKKCQLGGSGYHPAWYPFADKVVFQKLKAQLGLNHCKFAMTGAAPISAETLQYFGQLGLQINEVYGMSECTGATTWSTDQAHLWGSCGYSIPGGEVRVFNTEGKQPVEVPAASNLFAASEAEQGEICYRGRHIMAGYMANPDFGEEHMELIAKKNKEAIDEMGWLRSGDKGTVSKEGMFKITGRYKELIIGSGGENIAPVPIENEIKKICPGISNIMMVGDKKKYNTAFVTLQADGATGDSPGTDNLDGLALDLVSGITTISAASQNSKYLRIIQDAITATNGNGAVCPSNASKIQKFTILPHDFSVETGELTPTLKLKRSAVMAAPEYQDILERLYAPGAGDYVAFNPKHQVEVGAATEPEKEAEAPVGPGVDSAPLMETDSASSTNVKAAEGVDKV